MNPFSTFAEFTKVESLPDGTLRAHARINDETVDDQGEILDYLGTKAALDDFMVWANVREMHQASAVGVVESIAHDDIAKVSEGILHIVDPVAVQKTLAGVYKGTSVGGSKGAQRVMEKAGDAQVVRLMAPRIVELSLVDRPSRPTAQLTLLKRSDNGADNSATLANDEPEGDTVNDQAAAATDVTDQAAAEAPRANEEPPVLTKAAGDDIMSIHVAKERIAELIESETAEGDTVTVAALQAAMTALNDAEASEQTELGTPADTAEAVEDEAEEEAAAETAPAMAMAYSSVIDDLAKRAGMAKIGKRNAANDQANIDQIHDLAVAAGAYPGDHEPPAAPPADDTEAAAKVAQAAADTSLADGIIALISDRVPLAKAADLDTMKGEFLEALEAQRKELAKIAAQPMSGGPVRYAESARFGDQPQQPVPAGVAAALQKISDPRVRDEVGQALAAEAIAGIHLAR